MGKGIKDLIQPFSYEEWLIRYCHSFLEDVGGLTSEDQAQLQPMIHDMVTPEPIGGPELLVALPLSALNLLVTRVWKNRLPAHYEKSQDAKDMILLCWKPAQQRPQLLEEYMMFNPRRLRCLMKRFKQ